jgi:chromosome partitioning protein
LGPVIAAAAKHGTDLVIIDGAAVARDVAHLVAQHADLVLIPTKAAVFDTMSMMHTLDIVRQLDKPVAVVLTFVSPQGQETADAKEAMAQLGADVCDVTIGNRKAFFRAQGQGLAAQEFEPRARRQRKSPPYTIIQIYAYTAKKRRRSDDQKGRW